MDAIEVASGTYGALLLGALAASGLSGVFTVQCVLYFKIFPLDRTALKGLVVFVWLLDLLHTALVWSAIWGYFISNFGASRYVDHIPSSIALSVILTATLTFVTHCLFAHRIHCMSERNVYITFPIMLLASGRLAAASVSGGEMIHLRSYTIFRRDFLWLFTTGLGLSSAVDILITLSLFLLLKKSRKQSVKLHGVLDSLILYTFEIGSLTCAATIASLLCWVILDDSLIFLGLHFVIGKLYANSLVATLNARQELRQAHSTAFDFLNLNLTSQRNDQTQVEMQVYNPEVPPGRRPLPTPEDLLKHNHSFA
ncbi:hypothetical protein B0H34DRAFT_6932 [Crassisporium funariophilum]|nr:hypothetical protein B0H34DRAFT_6932 [Crassisporium funariophilum]